MVTAALTTLAVGAATPAFAATPTTVAGVRARADAKAQHITAKMQALQSRLATRPQLAGAKSTLQADITKVLADTAAWRRQVDAATTMAGVRAADPAHRTVKADLAKLHTDLGAAKATKTTAH
jgi:uncharacterized pyridoxal phosphate-containing UPF0001 family protein